MSSLRVTLIDVGWGDSLLLESEDVTGAHYALIDSNDTSTLRSSYIFLKRFFEKRAIAFPSPSSIFEWVLLTHRHADHGQGLKKVIRDFGTDRFWYSNSPNQPTFFADLLRYATKSPRVGQYDVVDTSKILPSFGAASMQALWPLPGVTSNNENDNSVVLAITLGQVVFVLTGDAEADGVWTHIASQIPANTRFFKVPHHGSANGTFTGAGTTHVTFYIWPRAADSQFHFVFRPRFAMKAQSAQSVVYDYYNPDERVVLAPTAFTVE
jgi:competence protein ComEC